MKKRVSWLLVPAVIISLGACKKKETAETPSAATPAPSPSGVTAPAVVETPAPVVPKVSIEERAAKLGFAKHLPADTEVLLTFHDGTKTVNRVKTSKFWNFVTSQSGMNSAPEVEAPLEELEMQEDGQEIPEGDFEGEEVPAKEVPNGLEIEGSEEGMEPGEPELLHHIALNEDAAVVDADAAADAANSEPMGPAALFGTEFSLALGKTSGEQMGNLFTFQRRMSYYNMRGMAKAMAAALKSGDKANFTTALGTSYDSEMFSDLLQDPQSGLKLLAKTKMSPLYLAFKTTESNLAEAAQQVSAILAYAAMLEDKAVAIDTEKEGHKFTGYKILGSEISKAMAEDRAEMDEKLTAATVDELLAIIAKQEIVIVSGTVGEYVTVFVGASIDDLKIAAKPSDSLVAGDTLAFADAYIGKDLAALVYGEKQAMTTLLDAAGGMAEITNGIRDGFAGAEGMGDTRDLEALFQMCAEREAALRKLASNDASGIVAFHEDGFKIESYGGYDSGGVDWKASNKLAHLGDSEDVVIFANLTGEATYDKNFKSYFEALFETAYALSMKFSEVPMTDPEFAKFQGMAKMFDSKFRTDLVSLYDALNDDFGGGLGQESALIVDLKGAAPAIPGMPQALVDEAKVPRISLVSPVTDRAKLAGAWTKINTTLTGTMAKVSELTGTQMPMQKPISSEKDGTTTWFVPMPFFNDDFLPSVTVNDQWFAASTSKNQALDLIAQATKGGKTRSGFLFNMNFKALGAYAKSSYALVDKNAEALMGAPLTPEKKKQIEDGIAVFEDFDKITMHGRREGAVVRSSVHFKTR